MSKTKVFEIKLNSTAQDFLERVRTVSEKNGVQLKGDTAAGHFAGHGVEGNYRIVEDVLSLSITKKPMILPWTLIETKVRSFFV